ncbi:MAG: Hpt domain-containing protein [Planctomycetes bacterium]|nr:Hpt domain-containing protein [Planctomycetota bacterium]
MSNSRALLDASALDQLRELDEDGAVLMEVVETFLRDAPKQVAAIQGAIINNDAKSLDRAAHTLKSTAATVGAMDLSAICKEVEQIGRSGQVEPARACVEKIESEFRSVDLALQAELSKLQKN